MREVVFVVSLQATDPNGRVHERSIQGYSSFGDVGFYIWAAGNVLRLRKVAGELKSVGFRDIALSVEKDIEHTLTSR